VQGLDSTTSLLGLLKMFRFILGALSVVGHIARESDGKNSNTQALLIYTDFIPKAWETIFI
jgi:hypothetical protein